VRPHDLVLRPDPDGTSVEAQVSRIVHLGFEVRVELELAGDGAVAAQLTRHEAEQLELAEGDIVYVRSTSATAPSAA
jgi:sulfate transport system ATP-binding protein